MALKIKKASEKIENDNIKSLIYGEPGIGKTTLSLTAPQSLLIDCDAGIRRVDPEFRKDYLQVAGWEDVQELLKSKDELENYNTLVIDTVGKLLDYISAALIKNDHKLGSKVGGLTLQGYGSLLNTFRKFLADVSMMGKNIIFIAHDREFSDGDMTKIRPDIQGRSMGSILREMDLVGYMQSRGNERTISFSPSDKFYAKNTCQLPAVMKIPDLKTKKTFPMTDIFQKYKEMLESQSEVMEKYQMLISVIEESVDSIKDPETAEEVSAQFKTIEEIWDSRAISKMLFSEKLKKLNLQFNKVSGKYEAKVESKDEKK